MSQLNNNLFIILTIIVITAAHRHTSHATPPQTTASHRQILTTTANHHHHKQTTRNELFNTGEENPRTALRFLLPTALSFLAAAISSAGGIGGGGLFIPILTITAGFDLKKASTFSAFMVTGGSIANVACHVLARPGPKTKPLINYDIALLSEPCMLLGVSLGVVLNVIFPEWLITLFFVGFIAVCTFQTCKNGVVHWKAESDDIAVRREGCESTKVPLLGERGEEGSSGIPWVKLGMLVVIWIAFFVLNLLRGNRYGEGIIKIESCGATYWIISSLQIPLAIIFTAIIIMHHRMTTEPKNISIAQQETGQYEIISCSNNSSDYKLSNNIIFPTMALLAGILGGVFGIGGGMFISPLLLQIGINPKVTAGTCSFMVLFSSTMSAVQYLLLGMSDIYGALIYATICFVASLLGLTLVHRAVIKHGRSSVIVFSVGIVMAFSTVLMTSYGALNVWRDYMSGKSMGFQKPC